ncbi:MAG: putative holin-like toxin [Defluviitaleaceae bacterium]|nr:putative holin-like toxin [Defluviitaleaceae bacterium]
MYEYLDSGVASKGGRMSVAEAIGLMFAFGMFILALLTYIDRTRKK